MSVLYIGSLTTRRCLIAVHRRCAPLRPFSTPSTLRRVPRSAAGLSFFSSQRQPHPGYSEFSPCLHRRLPTGFFHPSSSSLFFSPPHMFR